MKPAKHVKQYFHWLLVVAPLVSLGTALLFKFDERPVELVFIFASVLANLGIILRTLRFDKNSEQSFIRTFLYDELDADKSGKPLEFHTQVVVIEDESKNENFLGKLKLLLPSKESGELILRGLAVGKSAVDLPTKLTNARAVLVIRTEELENTSWLYDALESWAFERSDVPILYTYLAPEKRKSKVPNHYRSIPNDPASVPWMLMQRASQRGFDWRRVASFNRLLATNFVILLVVSFLLGFSLITSQQKDEYAALQSVFAGIARQTKVDYQKLTPDQRDGDFDVSYWFRYKGEFHWLRKPDIYQLIFTEDKPTHMYMTDNKQSCIGCAFAYGSVPGYGRVITQWEAGKPDVVIWNDKDESISDPACKFTVEYGTGPNTVVCGAFNESNTPFDPNLTVGICVFTRGQKLIIGADRAYRDFLRNRVNEFYRASYALIKKKELIPLTD